MNIKSIFQILAIVGCLQFHSVANAVMPGEGISFDASTGDYTVLYFVQQDDGSSLLQKTIFEPATKIEPFVRSKIRSDSGNLVIYRYTILSSPSSQQKIGTIRFDLVSKINGSQDLPATMTPAAESQLSLIINANKIALETPHGWNGSIFPNNVGGVRVSWNPVNNNGIQSGNSVTEFGFSSQYLPGIGSAVLQGIRKRRVTYAGDGPQGDIKQQFDTLRQTDFVSRNAAIPIIAIPVPFNAAALLDNIRAQVDTWPSKQLLDPAFASQLDRYMVAAANAYRSNQPRVGKEQIESVRQLLEHEHRYLDHDEEDHEDTAEHKAATRLTINRLAARVLDFDLRYVLKRMEHEHDEGDGRKGRD